MVSLMSAQGLENRGVLSRYRATHQSASVQASTPDKVERARTHEGSKRVDWPCQDRIGRHVLDIAFERIYSGTPTVSVAVRAGCGEMASALYGLIPMRLMAGLHSQRMLRFVSLPCSRMWSTGMVPDGSRAQGPAIALAPWGHKRSTFSTISFRCGA